MNHPTRIFALLIAVSLSTAVLVGQGTQTPVSASSANSGVAIGQVSESVLNINDISLWVGSNGCVQPFPFWWVTVDLDGPYGPIHPEWSMMYPRGEAGLLYQDGMLWVGKLWDGQQSQVVLGGGRYETGDQPGAVLAKGVAENPKSESARIYRYRPDYESADLREDAAGVYRTIPDSVTDEMIDAVRAQYVKDASEWPWQRGAPFEDADGNGVMDAGERPGLRGADQVLWFAYNDLDGDLTNSVYGRAPVGMEVQVTMWAHQDDPDLKGIVFKRYRYVFKGAVSTTADARVDSMYLMQWSDYDAGMAGDDFGGCDSSLSMGFGYNAVTPDPAYKPFGWQVPAIGYAIMQGPIIPGDPADAAFVSGRAVAGFRNLPMTSFWLHATGTAGLWEDVLTHPYWYWYTAQGFAAQAWSTPRYEYSYWVDQDGDLTRFPFGGDPSSRAGWVDGLETWWGTTAGIGYSASWGGRSIILNTGPFTMALGDTQEVVIALVAGKGADGPASVNVLKYYVKRLRSVFPHLDEFALTSVDRLSSLPNDFELLQNYPNPFNPSTTIEYRVPRTSHVRLAIYDGLGREVCVLEEAQKLPGAYRSIWDGSDQKNQAVATGVYFCRMTSEESNQVRKLLLLR